MTGTKLRICAITSSRADYGLLYCPLRALADDPYFDLQLVVTGSHLKAAHGHTFKIIEQDGFKIALTVEIPMSSESRHAIAETMSAALVGITDALEFLKPDLVLLLGDRYEIFSAAQAAMICNIPIAHIAGGDTTEGAIDESIRHGITKMSHIHFVTNEQAAQRVRQLGEDERHIFNTGSPGIDFIRQLKLLEKQAVEEKLGFALKPKNLLVTFHPTTLEPGSAAAQVTELLAALSDLDSDYGIIFTAPNADLDSDVIAQQLREFTASHSNAKLFTSLGQELYLSTLSLVDAVVGNSSSGLYEAPSFKKPTVNIGNRQKGRLQTASIIDCEASRTSILAAINKALQLDCSLVENPYGDGHSSERIVKALKGMQNYPALLSKHFHDIALPAPPRIKQSIG